MKKIFLSLVALLFSFQAFGHLEGGTETHGGDIYALRFVKIANILTQTFEKYPGSALAVFMDVPRFKRLILETNIQTTDDPRPFYQDKNQSRAVHYDEAGSPTILVWRMDWVMGRNDCETEFKMVLSQYLALLGKTDSEVSAILGKPFSAAWDEGLQKECLLPLVDLARNKIVFHSGDLVKETRELAQSVLNLVIAHPEWVIFETIDPHQMQTLILHLQIEPVYIPGSLGGLVILDSLNIKIDSKAILRAELSVFASGLYGERLEFMFHELLELQGIKDSRYQLSAKLYGFISQDYFSPVYQP